MHAADYVVQGQTAMRDSVQGKAFPVLKVKGNLMQWNGGVDLPVDLSPVLSVFADLAPLLPSATQAKLAQLQDDGIKIKVRDDLTGQVSLMVAQPLGQLYSILSGVSAGDAMIRAAQADELTTKRALELDVVRGYTALVGAEKALLTVQAAERQILAIEKQVEQTLAVGMVEQNALLKVRVQKAEISKQKFQVEKGVRLARVSLNLLMGQDMNASLEVEESAIAIPGEMPASASPDLRPEAVALSHRLEAVRQARKVAVGDMLPQLNAVAGYEYTAGYGKLQKENVLFAGAVLDWNVFEWGSSWKKVREAKAREAEVQSRLAFATDRIRLDQEARRLDFQEAERTLAVAMAEKEATLENLRVEQTRFDVQETTVTDLLAAQTVDIKAENDLIQARMKVWEARAALRVALGQELLSEGDEQ